MSDYYGEHTRGCSCPTCSEPADDPYDGDQTIMRLRGEVELANLAAQEYAAKYGRDVGTLQAENARLKAALDQAQTLTELRDQIFARIPDDEDSLIKIRATVCHFVHAVVTAPNENARLTAELAEARKPAEWSSGQKSLNIWPLSIWLAMQIGAGDNYLQWAYESAAILEQELTEARKLADELDLKLGRSNVRCAEAEKLADERGAPLKQQGAFLKAGTTFQAWLKDHDDELIEKCAKIADSFTAWNSASAIRALKPFDAGEE